MIDLVRDARAAELGVHAPPQSVTCEAHGQVHAVSYVLHCPDELSCGCRFVPEPAKLQIGGLARCTNCGWPTSPTGPVSSGFPAYCGDGRHGCLAVGG